MPETLETFIHEIARHPASHPFRLPVDGVTQGIPMYDRIVHRSMDISTIQGKVKKHLYQLPHEMHHDVCLMLANCFFFNDANDYEVYGKGLQLRHFYLTNVMPRLLACSQLYEQIAYPDVPYLLAETARIAGQCLRWRELWSSAWTEAFGAERASASLKALKETEPCCATMTSYLEAYNRLRISGPRGNSNLTISLSSDHAAALNGTCATNVDRKPGRRGGRGRPRGATATILRPSPQSLFTQPQRSSSTAPATTVVLPETPTLSQSTCEPKRISDKSTSREPSSSHASLSYSAEASVKAAHHPLPHVPLPAATTGPFPSALPYQNGISSSVVSGLGKPHPGNRGLPLSSSDANLHKEREQNTLSPRPSVDANSGLARSRVPRNRKPSQRLLSEASPEENSQSARPQAQTSVALPPPHVPSVPPCIPLEQAAIATDSPQLPPLPRSDSQEPADEQSKKLFQSHFDQLNDVEKDKVIDFIQTCQPKICLKAHHHVSLKKISQRTVVRALEFMKSAHLLSRGGSIGGGNSGATPLAGGANGISRVASSAALHKPEIPTKEECAKLDYAALSLRQDTAMGVGAVTAGPFSGSVRKEKDATAAPASASGRAKSSTTRKLAQDERPESRTPKKKSTSRVTSASRSSGSTTSITSPTPAPVARAAPRRKTSTSSSEGEDEVAALPSRRGGPDGIGDVARGHPGQHNRSLTSGDSDEELSSPMAFRRHTGAQQRKRNSSIFSHEDSDDEHDDSSEPFNQIAMSIVQEEREKQRHQEEQERRLKEEKKNMEIYNANVPSCHRLKEREYNHTYVMYPKYVAHGLFSASQAEERMRDLERVERKWRERLEGEGRMGVSIPCDRMPQMYQTKRRRIEVNPGEACLSRLIIYGRNALRNNPILHPQDVVQLLPRLDLPASCLKLRNQ